MKVLLLLGLFFALGSCTVFINEKSIACISQIQFSEEAVNALFSTPSCKTFYTKLTTETELLKKIDFFNFTMCLAELKSLPDAAGLVIHGVLDKIHECTNIRLETGFLKNLF